jgi:hypothetical protein
MQILTISGKDSRPELAITAFLATKGIKKTSTTPAALHLTPLDNVDCVIYIEQLADSQVIDRLQQSSCPSILVADQDSHDSQCLFIPFGILDRTDSLSIGITIIQDFIDSISVELIDTIDRAGLIKDIDQFPDPNTHQRAPAISRPHSSFVDSQSEHLWYKRA